MFARGCIPAALLSQVKQIIENEACMSQLKEDEERKLGKILEDHPKACLVATPFPVTDDYCGIYPHEEVVSLWNPVAKVKQRYLLRKSVTTYLASRRRWNAFMPVYKFLLNNGMSASDVNYYSPQFFPYIYGCLTLMRHISPHGTKVLVGIRSEVLAGKNPGTISLPGGLVEPNESLPAAASRELVEEGGNCDFYLKDYFAVGFHLDCPSCTFIFIAETHNLSVETSYEWRGGRAIWIDETVLREALHGKNQKLVRAFKESNILADDNLSIAPDVKEPVRQLLEEGYPID